MSLRNILEDIEARHKVSFTYVDEDIDGIFLQPPSTESDLNESLRYLEKKTGLSFQQISDRFITISRISKIRINVCGVLVDQKDGSVIHGATIQGPKKFTVSNEERRF